MKKNGFTLIEILIVIIIIGIIATIAITSSMGSTKRMNQKLYEEKIDYVLTAAKQFGQSSTELFTGECRHLEEPVSDAKCFNITVKNLLDNNYIKADDVIDPRDVSANINNTKIEVQYYYDRVYAVVYEDDGGTSGHILINSGAVETNTRKVTLTIAATMTDLTNAQMCVSNGNSCTAWRAYNTLIDWELSNEAGEKTVSVWFKDRHGNVSNPAKDSILYKPTSANGTFVINNGDTYTGKRNVTLSITMNTAQTGVTSMCISNSNTCTTWQAFQSTINNWMLTVDDGLKTVKVWFRDEEGNQFVDLMDTIIYETVPPTGSIVINQGQYSKTRNVDLTLNAQDEGSGVGWMCISNTTTCPAGNYEAYSPTKSGYLLDDLDGSQTVSVWYKDNVGNESIRYSANVILDRSKPADGTIIINNGDIYTKTKNVTVAFTSSDQTSQLADMCVSQTKDCLAWRKFENTISLPLLDGEGVKTVYVNLEIKQAMNQIRYLIQLFLIQ